MPDESWSRLIEAEQACQRVLDAALLHAFLIDSKIDPRSGVSQPEHRISCVLFCERTLLA